MYNVQCVPVGNGGRRRGNGVAIQEPYFRSLSVSLLLSLSLYSHVLADFLTVVGGRGVYQIMGERVGISDSCMISLSLRVRIMYSQYEYKYTPPPSTLPTPGYNDMCVLKKNRIMFDVWVYALK